MENIIVNLYPTYNKLESYVLVFNKIINTDNLAYYYDIIYKDLYLSFFSVVGFPINKLYSNNNKINFLDLQYGDSVELECVFNYRRVYQYVPKDININMCLILTQYLQFLNENNNSWLIDKIPEKIVVKHYPITDELKKIKIIDFNNIVDYKLDFNKFIMNNKNYVYQYVLTQLKINNINYQCNNYDKLYELIFDDFIKYLNL